MDDNNEYMLTTKDNPYNPFDHFVEWWLYDHEKGYNTCERLGRLTELRDDMSDLEQKEVCEHVMDEIIKYDPLDIYIKIKK